MSESGTNPPAQTETLASVLLKRNLDEVFLLLDFISGRSEKQLISLTMPDPDGGPDLNARQIVRHLAAIRYPPAGRRPEDLAADASFLMLAKDRLAALASPARGTTIAYTAMFARTEAGSSPNRLRRHFWPGGAPTAAGHAVRSLAESAFPGLSARVGWFNLLYGVLIWGTLLWLILTTFVYWDVAMGRSTLQRIDQIHRDRAALYQASSDFALPATCKAPTAQQAVGCQRFSDLSDAETQAMADLSSFRDCNGWLCVRALHVTRWGFILCGLDGGTMRTEASVTSLLSVFSNFVLPMMFGVLGTFVAAIRQVQLNVRDSTLSPRDFWSTLLSLPIGMVAGVAVGLFYSPSAAPTTGGGMASVDLTMTPSGLGFLAGYGSQAFFDALDLLKRNAFSMNGNGGKPSS